MPLERLRELIKDFKELLTTPLDELYDTKAWYSEPDVAVQAGTIQRLTELLGAGAMTFGEARAVIGLPDSGIHASMAYYTSMAYISMPYQSDPRVRGINRYVNNQYQYSKFSEKVEQRAWELLKKYMTAGQHFAFMEGTTIEKQNKEGTYRILINRSGDFSILSGIKGEGIVQAFGRIKSYKYPLGDEIAAFLDWFDYKTEELIANWNCGTYGIVKEGERR